VYANGSVTATSFVGPLSGIASDLECSSCVGTGELSFDPATQEELDTESAARASADATLETAVSGRVLKSGDIMSGTLTLPANGLVAGTNQLVLSGGNVGIGATPDLTYSELYVYRGGTDNNLNFGLRVVNETSGTAPTKYGMGVENYGSVTSHSYGANISNTSTNSTTDSVNKYGLFIGSDGDFTGGGGGANINRGLSVRVSGADENYAATFEGGNVGIGVFYPSNILTVEQSSSTDPIADAWTTYSSRRWKTNIVTLQGALDKVERLRGVSYDAKADGQHNIGLIAEEVGEVVPEVVAYEANGQDAKSVDYARLTALLIEAVKEQQVQLKELRAEVERLNARLNTGVEVATR
jgi:hypothetical protein